MPNLFLLHLSLTNSWSTVFWTVPAANFQNTDIEAVARLAQAEFRPDFRAQIGNGQPVVLLCSDCEGQRMITIQISRNASTKRGAHFNER